MIFDSGAGGLSIAKTIINATPIPLNISYFADQSAFPYGNKEEAFLIRHVNEIIESFVAEYQPDLIIIACNTASTIVLPELRKRFEVPFVCVVPAIKPAAKLSQTQSIGILATPATVNRQYTATLIEDFAPHCKVSLFGSDKLVHCAENFVSGLSLDEQLIREELNQLLRQDPNIDTVVLACTHFPLIAPVLQAAAEHIPFWVDSAEAITRRTFDLLRIEENSEQNLSAHDHTLRFYVETQTLTTAEVETVTGNYRKFLEK